MPYQLDIGGNYTIRFDAVSLSTGGTIGSVIVSNARILAEVVTAGGGSATPPGPFMLVPGPNA